MFSAMFSTVAWGAAISLMVMIAAFLADGRGKRLLEAFNSKSTRNLTLGELDAAAREGSDWRLVAPLEDEQPRVTFEHAGR